ncbi:MAG: tape measure protein [Oscillospiraceae bacterium]|nr:tape measure protein [Oscillospiraceae bacterium]
MATRTIGTTIKIDGEKAFNDAMKSVNANLRVLKSDLAAVTAEFQSQSGSMTALTAKYNAQRALYDQQRAKVKDLGQAVKESTDRYGENAKETDRLRTSYNRARAELANMDAGLKKTSQELNQARSATQGTSQAVDQLTESADKSSSGLTAWGVAVGNVLAQLAQKGAQIIKEIATTGIQYNAQIEKYSTALTTALGSAALASDAITQIKQDAATTPYSLDTLVQANSLLISTGESSAAARETIMALSNAVSATGGGNDELSRMALNLQQVKNVGQAAAIDIKQFAMAGIDVYGILADYTGKSTQEVKNLTVTYDMLSGALIKASQEGGKYFGANAAQAATLNGQISTLKDNVKSKLGEAFEGVSNVLSGKLLPAVNKFVNGLDMGKILDDFDNLMTAAVAVGGAIAAMKTAAKIGEFAEEVRAAATAFAAFTNGMSAAEIQQAALNGTLSGTNLIMGLLGGQIEATTAKQLALNAAGKAFPGAAIAASITGIILLAKKMKEDVGKIKDEILGDIDTSNIDELKTKLQELIAEYERLQRLMAGGDASVSWQEVAAHGAAIDQTTAQIADCTAAEADHAAYLETTEGKCETLSNSLKDLMQSYEDAYTSARESLEGQFALFEQADEVTSISVDSMLAAMGSQTEYFNNYAGNLTQLQTMTGDSIGLNAEMVASLSDGSAQSAQYAQSIVQGYQDALSNGPEAAAQYVSDMNAAFAGQQAAIDEAAAAMAESQTDFSAKWAELSQTAADGAADMDQAAAMEEAGTNTIQGYIDGLDGLSGPLAAKAREMAALFTSTFNSSVGGLNLPSISGGGGDSSAYWSGATHAKSGLDYVPYDEFPAVLHKGEMVLTAAEAEALRNSPKTAAAGRQTIINLYPQSVTEATVDYLYKRFNNQMGWES